MAISSVRSRSQAPAASIWSCRLGLLGQQLVEVGVGVAHGVADLVEPVEQALISATPSATLPATSLVCVELRLLGQVADGEPGGQAGFAGEAVVDAGHDPQQRGLARPVGADHADLGARDRTRG